MLTATLTVALMSVLVAIGNSIRRKMRAQKLLVPVPGPKGTFLLGLIPELTKNIHRIYDFQVRVERISVCTVLFACEYVWLTCGSLYMSEQADLMVQYGGRTMVPWNLIGDNTIYVSPYIIASGSV